MGALFLASATKAFFFFSLTGSGSLPARSASWSHDWQHRSGIDVVEFTKRREANLFTTHQRRGVKLLSLSAKPSQSDCGLFDRLPSWVAPAVTGGIVNPITAPILRKVAAAGASLAGLVTGTVVSALTSPAVNGAIRDLGAVIESIERESARVTKNAVTATNKAISDVKAEGKRGARNLGDAADAIGGYVHDKTKGTVKSYSRAFDRMREGKIVDALWHVGTDQWKIEDDAAGKAAMKSSILRTVGQVSASVYGGPGGTAAYAAWLTYHQSGGDANMALKVGIISGATSWAMQTTGKLPSTDSSGNIILSEAGKKVVIAGAIGGAAMAAAGGDEDAIRDAFVKGGAMIIIQEGYKEYTKHPLDEEALKGSKGEPYCISSTVNCQEPPADAAVYKDGKFKGWDQSKLNPSAPHVGMSFPDSPISPGDVTVASEGSGFMQGVSKIPGMNAMAVFHDQWSMGWSFPPGVLQGTIYPAVVLTYNGTTAPLLEDVRVAARKRKEATRVLGDHHIVYVAHDDVPRSAPVVDDQVEASFACASDHEARSIVLEVDPSHEAFACRVIYRAKNTRTVPWRATYEGDYCAAKARRLADVHVRAGYRCLVAYPTDREPAAEGVAMSKNVSR